MQSRREFVTSSALVGAGYWLAPACASTAALNTAALSQHRVSRVERVSYRFSWPRLVGRNAIKDVHGQHHTGSAVKIFTDQGATGWGMTGGNRSDDHSAILGKKVSELIDVKRGIPPAVSRQYDVALFDLAGIILNKPVYTLLGERMASPVKVYSGMIYLDELPAKDHEGGMEAVMQNCAWDVDYGYRYLKVKVGRGHQWYKPHEGLQKDVDVVNAIHAKFSPAGIRLMVDANDGFTMAQVQQFLLETRHTHLYWLEEPFAEERAKSGELRRFMLANGLSAIRYADGEVKPDIALLTELVKDNTLQVILPDTIGYGFSRWIPLLQQMKSLGVESSPHAFGDMLKTIYTAHLAAGVGGIDIVEGVTCTSPDIDYGTHKLVDGNIQLSSAPGFGVTLKA